METNMTDLITFPSSGDLLYTWAQMFNHPWIILFVSAYIMFTALVVSIPERPSKWQKKK